MRTTPRVILILKQASSATRRCKILAKKIAVTHFYCCLFPYFVCTNCDENYQNVTKINLSSFFLRCDAQVRLRLIDCSGAKRRCPKNNKQQAKSIFESIIVFLSESVIIILPFASNSSSKGLQLSLAILLSQQLCWLKSKLI